MNYLKIILLIIKNWLKNKMMSHFNDSAQNQKNFGKLL